MFVVTEAKATAFRAAFDEGRRTVGRSRTAPAVSHHHRYHASPAVRSDHRRLKAAGAATTKVATEQAPGVSETEQPIVQIAHDWSCCGSLPLLKPCCDAHR